MKTVDLLVVALNRRGFSALMESIRRYFDYRGYKLRLILHVDWHKDFTDYDIDVDIKKYEDMFSELIVCKEDENVGHTKSVLFCLRHIQNDWIFTEDDKEFRKKLSLDFLVKLKHKSGKLFDAISLEGHQGRLGNCETNFYRKELGDYLVANFLPEWQWTNDCERMQKILFKHKHYLYYEKFETNCVSGTRMDFLAERGLIRRRKHRGMNSPIYVSVPSHITYILHGTKSSRRIERCRDFFLCINSFPIQRFEKIDIDKITTSHVGILASDCRICMRVTYQLDYDEIQEYELSGSKEGRMKIFYVKTHIFKQAYKDNFSIKAIIDKIWEYSEGYSLNGRNIQSWGFEVDR